MGLYLGQYDIRRFFPSSHDSRSLRDKFDIFEMLEIWEKLDIYESWDSWKIWDLRILVILQVKEESYMISPIYRDPIGYNKVEDSSSRIPCIIILDDSLAMICKYFWFSISSGLLVKCEVSNAANEKLLEGREGYCKTWTSQTKQSVTFK